MRALNKITDSSSVEWTLSMCKTILSKSSSPECINLLKVNFRNFQLK